MNWKFIKTERVNGKLFYTGSALIEKTYGKSLDKLHQIQTKLQFSTDHMERDLHGVINFGHMLGVSHIKNGVKLCCEEKGKISVMFCPTGSVYFNGEYLSYQQKERIEHNGIFPEYTEHDRIHANRCLFFNEPLTFRNGLSLSSWHEGMLHSPYLIGFIPSFGNEKYTHTRYGNFYPWTEKGLHQAIDEAMNSDNGSEQFRYVGCYTRAYGDSKQRMVFMINHKDELSLYNDTLQQVMDKSLTPIEHQWMYAYPGFKEMPMNKTKLMHQKAQQKRERLMTSHDLLKQDVFFFHQFIQNLFESNKKEIKKYILEHPSSRQEKKYRWGIHLPNLGTEAYWTNPSCFGPYQNLLLDTGDIPDDEFPAVFRYLNAENAFFDTPKMVCFPFPHE